MHRIVTRVGVWVGIVVLGWALPAAGQLHVKVHKDLITVSAPNSSGIVAVAGNGGAVTSSSPPTSFYIENLSSKVRVPITLRSDGGFSTRIKAEAGQQVRVMARISGGKQSYGTFHVPLASTGTGNRPAATPPAAGITLYRPDLLNKNHPIDALVAVDPNDPLPPDMTIIVTFVEPETGRILATRSLSARTGIDFSDNAVENVPANIKEADGDTPPPLLPEKKSELGQFVDQIMQAILTTIIPKPLSEISAETKSIKAVSMPAGPPSNH